MFFLHTKTKTGLRINISRNYFKIIHSDPVKFWHDNLVCYHLIKQWKIGLKYFGLYLYRGDFFLYEFDFYQIEADFLKKI